MDIISLYKFHIKYAIMLSRYEPYFTGTYYYITILQTGADCSKQETH